MYLKHLRESNNIKAIDVYEILRIDKATFKKLEEGRTELRADWIPILSRKYGISEKELYENYISEKENLKRGCKDEYRY